MFPWGRLPTDIRCLVLKAFCLEIIRAYEDAFSESKYMLKRIIETGTEGGFHVPEDFVYPSATLSSFVSAIQACREFNDIILNILVVHNDSPRDHLYSLQAELLRRIVTWEIFFEQDPEIQDINNIVHGSFEFYLRSLGNFWKNPLVIENWTIPTIVSNAGRKTSPTYFPRLGPWLAHHSVENPGYPALTLDAFSYTKDDYDQCTTAQKEFQDTVFSTYDTRPLPKPSWNVSPRIGLKRVNVYGKVVGTIVGISPSSNHPEAGEVLLEVDIKTSRMDDWWYIPQLCNSYGIGGREMEFGAFVNYKERRLYYLQNPRRTLAWEHPLDGLERWKSLHSLEEIVERRNRRLQM